VVAKAGLTVYQIDFLPSQTDYPYLKHTLTANQIGNAVLMAEWRALVERYNTKPGKEKYVQY